MSFHENTQELVNGVCMLEFSNAVEKHGKTFNSMHEAWAVLKEEVEEVGFDLAELQSNFRTMWQSVRMNNNEDFMEGVNSIQNSAIRAMMELAQVWAVCEKMKGK